jgi:putative oxidoreductase
MNPTQHHIATSIGLLILRLGMGGYMLTHGIGKLKMVRDGQFAEFGGHLGLSPTLSLLLVTFAEFLCAILVMAGLVTRLAAVPIVFTMAVAAFIVHGSDPWTMGYAAELFFKGASKFPVAKQLPLMFAIAFLALVFTGPGRFSLDALLWPRRKRRR